MDKKWLPLWAAVVILSMAPAVCAQNTEPKTHTTSNSPAAARGVESLGPVRVKARQSAGPATQAEYSVKNLALGPLGRVPLLKAPYSVTVVPEQLIVNQQAQTVNEVLRNLPSVEIRDQQGLQISRPQSRGFTGTVVQNTRLDGMNIIGATVIPAENLSSIQVLNGLAGSLYGPETPAGVFNYVLKRPPPESLLSYTQSFNSDSVLTGHLDAGGRAGTSNQIGYRLNLVHGEGQGFVSGSRVNRTLASGGFDYSLNDQTTIQTNLIHYESAVTGLPGSVVYGSGGSTALPQAVDPTREGLLGQPGAGNDLSTDTGLVKVRHDFGTGWQFEIGGLYQVAIRNLLGITNKFTDNRGDFDVIKNFNAVSRYTIFSNMARLSGHFDLFSLPNDLSIGTNGFNNGSYNYRDSIAVPLGKANINQAVIFPTQPIPANGGRYKSGNLTQQSLIAGDTLHFNPQWALQGVLSTSFGSSESYAKDGATTHLNNLNDVWSPTISVIFTSDQMLTTYASYATSTEQGDIAPTGTANANEFLAPYHDTQFEAGAKYAVSDHLLLTLAAFRMARPLASTNPATNLFQVIGTQRDDGIEVFAQGSVTPQISILGGVSYVNARLVNTGTAATEGKLVIGIPELKSDIFVDYHPDWAPGFALTGTVHAESRRAATLTNNSFAPGYVTLDAGARYSTRIGQDFLTVRLQLSNATDVYYYSSIAGGNIVGSAGANTAYFAAPRAIDASVTLDF